MNNVMNNFSKGLRLSDDLLHLLMHFNPQPLSRDAILEKLNWRVEIVSKFSNEIFMPTFGEKEFSCGPINGPISKFCPEPTGCITFDSRGIFGGFDFPGIDRSHSTISVWGLTRDIKWVYGHINFIWKLADSLIPQKCIDGVESITIDEISIEDLLKNMGEHGASKIINGIDKFFFNWT